MSPFIEKIKLLEEKDILKYLEYCLVSSPINFEDYLVLLFHEIYQRESFFSEVLNRNYKKSEILKLKSLKIIKKYFEKIFHSKFKVSSTILTEIVSFLFEKIESIQNKFHLDLNWLDSLELLVLREKKFNLRLDSSFVSSILEKHFFESNIFEFLSNYKNYSFINLPLPNKILDVLATTQLKDSNSISNYFARFLNANNFDCSYLIEKSKENIDYKLLYVKVKKEKEGYFLNPFLNWNSYIEMTPKEQLYILDKKDASELISYLKETDLRTQVQVLLGGFIHYSFLKNHDLENFYFDLVKRYFTSDDLLTELRLNVKKETNYYGNLESRLYYFEYKLYQELNLPDYNFSDSYNLKISPFTKKLASCLVSNKSVYNMCINNFYFKELRYFIREVGFLTEEEINEYKKSKKDMFELLQDDITPMEVMDILPTLNNLEKHLFLKSYTNMHLHRNFIESLYYLSDLHNQYSRKQQEDNFILNNLLDRYCIENVIKCILNENNSEIKSILVEEIIKLWREWNLNNESIISRFNSYVPKGINSEIFNEIILQKIKEV